ncbi:MAG: DUF1631 family protein [Burkholderiaceae bacterium]
MAIQSAVLQQVFNQAAESSRRVLEHCVDQALASLQEAENKSQKVAERNELGECWRELMKHKQAWAEEYPADLLKAFAAAAKARPAPGPGQQPTPSSFAKLSLSLVDDSEVMEGIEQSRLLQHILPMVEQPLNELDALMSSAMGLPSVKPEMNPVRPEIFAQTFRAMINRTERAQVHGAAWSRHMQHPLGLELKHMYGTLANLLATANIRAATYRVLQTPSAPSAAKAGGNAAPGAAGPGQANGTGGPGGPGGAGGPGGPGSHASNDALARQPASWHDLSNYEIGDALFQDFLFQGGGGQHAQQPLAPSYYEQVDQELAALEHGYDSAQAPFHEEPAEEYHAMPAVDRPQRHVGIESPLNQQVWGQYGRSRERSLVRSRLKKEAKQVGQVLGLEVVRKIVNQVAQDPRLLAPVREAIVALEPSLLRLAMVDPRYFSEEDHPGRRLVERVAERSFKYNDEFSTEFKSFFGDISKAFNALNGEESVETPEPFAEALRGFEDKWDGQDQEADGQKNEVLKAVRFAEERQQMADQLAWDMSSRPDLESVPAVVQDFLFGPWALVMAHARLTDKNNQIDPGSFGVVVSDLLWSVKREVTLRQPAKLIDMIPGLVTTLRTGLDLLGHDPRESAAFFEALMKLHRPVLKLRARSRKDKLVELGTLDEEAPGTGKPAPRPDGQPWMAKNVLDRAGFEDTLPSDHAELTATPDDGSGAEEEMSAAMPLDAPAELLAEMQDEQGSEGLGQEEAEQILASLREGGWVDLYSRRKWLRAQLIWASTKGTLFMFVSHGGQPHSMTKRTCVRLLRDRLLRPVDMQGVVAQAIDALQESARPAGAASPETAADDLLQVLAA